MKEKDKNFSSEYDTGEKTNSTEIYSESPDFKIESDRYGHGKPIRIIIRGKIIDDQNKENTIS